MKIYLDNAATTFPKPSSVYDSVMNYMMNIGANPGRGGHTSSLEGSRIVYSCREALMKLFNFDKTENVIFTSNITASLNMLLKKYCKRWLAYYYYLNGAQLSFKTSYKPSSR